MKKQFSKKKAIIIILAMPSVICMLTASVGLKPFAEAFLLSITMTILSIPMALIVGLEKTPTNQNTR